MTVEGEGIRQMTILLHKPYLVKVITKGEWCQNTQKKLARGLWMTPSSEFDFHWFSLF